VERTDLFCASLKYYKFDSRASSSFRQSEDFNLMVKTPFKKYNSSANLGFEAMSWLATDISKRSTSGSCVLAYP
jgi:hypothetical protein